VCGEGGKDKESGDERKIKTEFLTQLDVRRAGQLVSPLWCHCTSFELQGVGTSNDGIIFLAATNKPDEIAAPMRRRLVKRIFIDLPGSSAGLNFMSCVGGHLVQMCRGVILQTRQHVKQ
jgi:SpoVK/Ycf46/Vps4 family AAA+-type ATPase